MSFYSISILHFIANTHSQGEREDPSREGNSVDLLTKNWAIFLRRGGGEKREKKREKREKEREKKRKKKRKKREKRGKEEKKEEEKIGRKTRKGDNEAYYSYQK